MDGFDKNKKREIEEKKVVVTCTCKTEEFEIFCSAIKTIQMGYKSKLSFYTSCPHCRRKIYIDKSKLPRSFVNQMYKKHLND